MIRTIFLGSMGCPANEIKAEKERKIRTLNRITTDD
jgi:hypothetical protein